MRRRGRPRGGRALAGRRATRRGEEVRARDAAETNLVGAPSRGAHRGIVPGTRRDATRDADATLAEEFVGDARSQEAAVRSAEVLAEPTERRGRVLRAPRRDGRSGGVPKVRPVFANPAVAVSRARLDALVADVGHAPRRSRRRAAPRRASRRGDRARASGPSAHRVRATTRPHRQRPFHLTRAPPRLRSAVEGTTRASHPRRSSDATSLARGERLRDDRRITRPLLTPLAAAARRALPFETTIP